ncbi:MAG: hypothetical protein PHS62_03695 [Patescibacteria group bacterium]|nr:hypothetical protein [Patescibacteria group bacterium]
MEKFGLKSEDVWEAKQNLVGFFGVLFKIDARLRKESMIKIITCLAQYRARKLRESGANHINVK